MRKFRFLTTNEILDDDGRGERVAIVESTPEDGRIMAAAPELLAVAEALLLFYTAGQWGAEQQTRWDEVTGGNEATTKVLADLARTVIAKARGTN